jgi:hypothetical protein
MKTMRLRDQPTPRRTQRGQTLILIFLGTLLIGSTASAVLGGHSVPEIRERVRDVMTDQTQRAAVDLTMDKFEVSSKRFATDRAKFEEDAFAAFARHDATPEQFRALTDRADALGLAAHKDLLDLRFELRSQLSDAQWRAVFEHPAQ